MKRVVATKEALVPAEHLPAIALGDHGSQDVVDALVRDATQPVEHPDVPFQKRLQRHVEAEMCRLRSGERQRRDQRTDPSPPSSVAR